MEIDCITDECSFRLDEVLSPHTCCKVGGTLGLVVLRPCHRPLAPLSGGLPMALSYGKCKWWPVGVNVFCGLHSIFKYMNLFCQHLSFLEISCENPYFGLIEIT